MAVKSSPNKPAARQPRPSQTTRTSRPRPPRNNDRFAHDIWGLTLIALGLVLLASLISGPHAGLLGEALVHGLRLLVGVGAWVFPFVLSAIGVMLIRGREEHTRTNFAGGAGLLFVIGIAWWHLGHSPDSETFQHLEDGGGFAGAMIAAGLHKMLGSAGSHIVLFFFTLGAIVWATDMRLLHLFDHAVEGGRRVTAPITDGARAGAQAAKAGAQAAKQGAAALGERVRRDPPTPNSGGAGKDAPVGALLAAPSSPAVPNPAPPELGAGGATVIPFKPTGPALDDDMPTVPKVTPLVTMTPLSLDTPKAPVGPLVIPDSLGDDGTKHEYVLPPLELLNESPPKPVHHESAALRKAGRLDADIERLQDRRECRPGRDGADRHALRSAIGAGHSGQKDRRTGRQPRHVAGGH